MIEILSKYKICDSFELYSDGDLKQVCNAPKDKVGVYLWSDLDNPGRLLYIGSSGRVRCDGKLQVRKSNGTGLYGRLVEGHQFAKVLGQKLKRHESLPLMMIKDEIQRIKIEWYVTWDELNTHIPAYVEAILLQRHYETFKNLPRWHERY